MDTKKRTILLIIGFSLFTVGMLALVVSMLDIRLAPIAWVTDIFGRLVGLIVHLLMIVTGLLLAALSRGNFSGEAPYSQERINS